MREENLIQVKEELSNRITAFMSALGQKRTFRSAIAMYRFTPKSGHQLRTLGCPLSANSGHRAVIRSVELIVQPGAKDVVGELNVRGRPSVRD